MCQVPEQSMRMRNDGSKFLLLFIASFILRGSFYEVLVTIQFVMNNQIFVKDRLYPTWWSKTKQQKANYTNNDMKELSVRHMSSHCWALECELSNGESFDVVVVL